MSTLLDIWVGGRPRTKGSMKPIVNWSTQKVRLEEEVKESKPWRVTIQNAIIQQCYVETTSLNTVKRSFALPAGWPYMWPVDVECQFFFEWGDEAAWPTGRQYGDIDKLLRNVLDALTTVKVYADDSQVVRSMGWKRFSATPGVNIRVFPASTQPYVIR